MYSYLFSMPDKHTVNWFLLKANCDSDPALLALGIFPQCQRS